MDKRRFWNEQYLLQAFLCFNNAFEIIFANYYMNLRFPDQMRETFPVPPNCIPKFLVPFAGRTLGWLIKVLARKQYRIATRNLQLSERTGQRAARRATIAQ